MKRKIQIAGNIRSSSRRQSRHADGFTLLELVIVIAMIAVITAIAVPSFEAIVYGSDINRAVHQFVSDLQLARMKAIRTQQPVTVAFVAPDRYTMTWTENNTVRTRTEQFKATGGRVAYENSPPGASPSPVASFVFTPVGLFDTSTGNAMGNVYLVDTQNSSKLYRIVTTASGSIEERRWQGSKWEGTPLTFTPTP